ncbi:MAG TPA: hypothetical protein VFZ66_14380 [Herpetosiphonaceae bacterium]
MPTPVNTTSQPSRPSIVDPALDRTVLFAPCVLDRGRFSWVWIVPTCPYCGKSHDHYGGPIDGDPYVYIGRMFAARCDATDRRRLTPDYPKLNLWYVLEPIQAKERAPGKTRAVGEG